MKKAFSHALPLPGPRDHTLQALEPAAELLGTRALLNSAPVLGEKKKKGKPCHEAPRATHHSSGLLALAEAYYLSSSVWQRAA